MSLPALAPTAYEPAQPGLLRAARLMKSLGPAASAVWAEFSSDEADALRRAMQGETGSDGQDETAELLEALQQQSRSSPAAGTVWARLSAQNPAQLARRFTDENPQVIALILSRLAPEAAADMVRALPRPLALDALRRVLHLGRIQADALRVIEAAMQDMIEAGLGHSDRDGDEAVARIFDRLDSRIEKGLLASLEHAEPGAAERIRALMFTFDDLARLEPAAIQTVLSGVDRAVLAIALKGAREAVCDVFLKNMTKRAGDLLVAEIAAIGPVRRSEIETARQEITSLARSLARRGDILGHASPEDELVE